jgi:hypothetical protein
MASGTGLLVVWTDIAPEYEVSSTNGMTSSIFRSCWTCGDFRLVGAIRRSMASRSIWRSINSRTRTCSRVNE